MRRGVWHQCGDRSQKLVLEQLQLGNGVGVILSPRDLSFNNACDYAHAYRDLGAEVTIDLQFYNPQFHNRFIDSYPTNEYRISVSDLCQINDGQLQGLSESLTNINGSIGATALIAPALIYETGRQDLVGLNSRLFSIAKQVGNDLGIPTYASVLLGRSATVSESSINSLLSSATALNCDGWYFGFEFNQNRIPNNYDDLLRFGRSLLTLASTGKPVLHSYSGPLSIFSMGFGATGTAIGHSQNLWQFTRGRWEIVLSGQGGGGDAPPRYFSQNLWGTFVYPDELFQLPDNLRQRLLTPTPFSNSLNAISPFTWSRWDANKHLIYIIGNVINQQAQDVDPRLCANFALEILTGAIQLGDEIQNSGLRLKDDTCCYQSDWKQALIDGLAQYNSDYDYLSLLM